MLSPDMTREAKKACLRAFTVQGTLDLEATLLLCGEGRVRENPASENGEQEAEEKALRSTGVWELLKRQRETANRQGCQIKLDEAF